MNPNEPTNPSKREIADDVKAKAEQATRDMKARGKEQLETQESRAADAVDKMAEATHAAARQLGEQDETTLSRYVSEIADGIGNLSSNLRNKNTDELIQEVSRLARNNAGLFLLGSVAVGFGLARIAKANRPDSEAHWEDYYGQQDTASYEEGRSPAASMGTSNPTHASTTYLPDEEDTSVQSPISPPTGASGEVTGKNGPGRSTS